MKKLLILTSFIVTLMSFMLIKHNNPKIPQEFLNNYNGERTILIDFSLNSYQKRLWVIEGDDVLLQTYVSHGKKSGNISVTHLSNVVGSNASCYGEFKTSEKFNGKHGLSLRVDGLDVTNNNARQRGIIFHAADYSTEKFILEHGRLGRSLGCFSTPIEDNKRIIELSTEKGSIPVIVLK